MPASTTTDSPPVFRGPLARALEALRGDDPLVLAPPGAALPTIRRDALDAATVAAFREEAEAELATPWPQPRAHDAARFHGDGDRVAWETPAFARQHRLTRAALLALATGEDRWLDETLDGAIMLCEQSSWCWPAHDDTRARHGAVLATVTDPYVDLGAGEVVGQLAWLDHVLGEVLEARFPGFRSRVRHEARTRIFAPFLARRDWHWIGLDGHVHNWNPWIHGNVLVGALQLLDAPDEADERLRIVDLVVEGLDRYVAVLPADGAIDEGYAYWWNGACRLLEALDVLAHATGHDPVPRIEAVRQVIAFPHRMHLGGEWFANAADGQARQSGPQPWHALHRAARRVGDRDAEAFAALHRDPAHPAVAASDGLGRVLRGAADPAWLGAADGADPLPERIWLPSTQMLVVRESGGDAAGLAVVAKGGHNGENHNHNDVGEVIVASDGVPVLVDAGRPTYEARTFGDERYELWPMRSGWHSVPFVHGREQPAGVERAAELVAVDDDGIELELAGAYDVTGLASWRRAIRLDRAEGGPGAGGPGAGGPGAGGAVVIADRWQLAEGGGPTEVRFVVAGEVVLSPGSARIRPLDGATPVVLVWDAAAPARVVDRALDDPMLAEVWGARLSRIDIDVSALAELTVVVRQDADAAGAGR
ncbi:heparinase II/III domain-containing protein [Microbacterium sp. NPDC055683]